MYPQHSSGPSKAATELNSWLRSYSRSPTAAAGEIRAILDQDKEQFYACAFRVIRQFDDSAGARFLAGLILERGLLLRAFSDPALPEQRVRGVIQALLAEDPGSDLVLVKAIADQALSQQSPDAIRALVRVLHNLEKLTDARRIVPRLLPLLRHADLRLRSKVVRIVGCCGRNKQWVVRQLADADARIRANAVEALWGVEDRESCDLLRTLTQDENNRVAGNAILGLYRAGDCSAIAGLLKMAGNAAPAFRATAAWAMGESGDPRFREALRALVGAENAMVRKRAAASLQILEAEAAKPESGLPWRMAALGGAGPEGGAPQSQERAAKRVRVAVQCADGKPPPRILPTRFWVLEDGRPVLDYRVEELEVPDTLALALVIPLTADGLEMPMVSGALRALVWKRPRDAWGVVRYKPPQRWNVTATLLGEIIRIAPPEEAPEQVDLPVFAADPEIAAQALEQPPEGPARRCLWDAILEANRACAAMAAAGAKSCMAIYCPCDPGTLPDLQAERMSAVDWTVPVHCIAWKPVPFVEDLCRRSQGAYHLVDGDAEVVETLDRLHIGLEAQYLVSYRGAPNAAAAIQVKTPEGCAKTAVRREA